MTKRKTPPLSRGEYVQPHPARSETVRMAQHELIRASARVFPAFLEGLRDTVFPTYAEIARRDSKLVRRNRNPWPHEATPEHEKVINLLNSWAKQFNVTEDWLLDDAFRALPVWFGHPPVRDALRWLPMLATRQLDIGKPFAFTFMAWQPQNKSWASFRQELRARFEEELRNYEKDTRREAEALGLVRTRHTYSPDNLEWFVLHQFGGMSYTKIVKWLEDNNRKCDESTVRSGIRTAEELIQWKRSAE